MSNFVNIERLDKDKIITFSTILDEFNESSYVKVVLDLIKNIKPKTKIQLRAYYNDDIINFELVREYNYISFININTNKYPELKICIYTNENRITTINITDKERGEISHLSFSSVQIHGDDKDIFIIETIGKIACVLPLFIKGV